MPVGAILGAVAAPLVGSIAGKVLGPKNPSGHAAVPRDVQGLRSNQLSILQQLLGGPNPSQAIGNYFGGFTNDMQRTSANRLSQFVNMQRPEQRTLDALQPGFQRNLAAANQSGGRFGTYNTLMRNRALEDFNILGANISNQAQQNQLQAANILAMLGQQEVSNRMGAISNLFQTANQAAFNVPITMSPSGAQQGAQLGSSVGQGIAQFLPYLFPQSGQGQMPGLPNVPFDPSIFQGMQIPVSKAEG